MLVVLMAGILFLVGWVVGDLVGQGLGILGIGMAFLLWVILSLVSYFTGDQIFLGMRGARKVGPRDHPVLYNVVEEMKIASGLPKMPAVYIIDSSAPNAFATGRNPERASVAVTSGLLRILDRDELQGVIAHEMGHIKNRDILYMLMVGVMMGAIVMLADFGIRYLFWTGGRSRSSRKGGGGGQAQAVILIIGIILMILAPIIAQIIYFTVSRKREYLADASSALFTRYPEGLASALEQLSRSPKKLHSVSRATAPMYIVNPLKVTKRGLSDLSSTHPRTSERIRILRSMGGAGHTDYNEAFRKVTGRAVGVVPASALISGGKAAISKPEKQDGSTQLERLRQATDLLWKLNSYIFIACACGTKLKFPPAYAGKSVECPHCGKAHAVKRATG